MSGHAHTVLILMAGPKFDLEWEFGERLRGLSAFSGGYLVTSGARSESVPIGRYEVRSTSFRPQPWIRRMLARLRFLRAAWTTMRESRRSGAPVELVVTYDPLLTGAIAAVLARVFGAKLICEVNGDYCDPANFMHVRNPALRAIKRWFAGVVVRCVLRRADGIRVLFARQLANVRYVPRPGQIVEQIPEFVNTGAFRDLGESPCVLLIGFPFFVKGVDIAIAAFKRIARDFPDWRLEIIGHYPDGAELDAAIAGDPAITYRPPVLHRDMNDHVGRCGIVIQPSRTESMGRVLVEAMAAGKPRIATRVGGIATVVDDGSDGLLVDSEDVDGLADALRRLMSDPELRRRMGEAGARRSQAEFSPARYCAAMQNLFDRVVDAPRTNP